MGVTLQRAMSALHGDRATKPLELDTPPEFAPSAWFLGPNGENLDVLTTLVTAALEGHADARKSYKDTDPDMAKGRGPDFNATVEAMQNNLGQILTELRGSIPLSSHRNQSHMYWDITMPGAAGYFAGMLYNQNNVAAEASPVTTAMEIGVARNLCHMLGFRKTGDIEPWGHITCDGSVANLESMWSARNLKYHAPALARAIRVMPELADAQDMVINTPDGRAVRMMDLDVWALLNLDVDEILSLEKRMASEHGIEEPAIQAAIDTYSFRALGAAAFDRDILHGEVPANPAVLVPATAHYSWDKAATILGMGTDTIIKVPVDLDGRMIVSELRKRLETCRKEKRPVLQVVNVLGTTHESAVDPLKRVLAQRQSFARREKDSLTFAMHVDAAWGGYFASMLVDPPRHTFSPDDEHTGFDGAPGSSMSDYVKKQYAVLGKVDSITVDPHKSGYIPYPAGSLCYRNKQMIYLVAHEAPVVFHGGEAPTVGVYGIEGSKPGAAAVGAYLSHATVPTDKRGYGRILGRCIFNSKRFYAALATLAKPDDDFIITPFNRLPAEKDPDATPKTIEDQRKLIRETFLRPNNDALVEMLKDDPKLMALFTELGPDLTVMSYSFNFKIRRKGKLVLNDDLGLMNKFNNAMFHALSVEEPGPRGAVPDANMFVTASAYAPGPYGHAFMEHYASRAGVTYDDKTAIDFLISTMQNPFVTHTADGNFIPTLMDVMRTTIKDVRAKLIRKHGLEEEES